MGRETKVKIYTVIDIGYPKNQSLSPSLFYNMELTTLRALRNSTDSLNARYY
jgi:hypothetical protein